MVAHCGTAALDQPSGGAVAAADADGKAAAALADSVVDGSTVKYGVVQRLNGLFILEKLMVTQIPQHQLRAAEGGCKGGGVTYRTLRALERLGVAASDNTRNNHCNNMRRRDAGSRRHWLLRRPLA